MSAAGPAAARIRRSQHRFMRQHHLRGGVTAIWHSMARISCADEWLRWPWHWVWWPFWPTTRNIGCSDIHFAKDQALAVEMFQKWNDFSRIGLVHHKEDGRYAIVIDADAATDIVTYDLDHLTPAQRHDLMSSGQALPYALRPAAKTLVIGPGGGYSDVARAVATGSRDVTGVEINPIIARTIMQERFPELSHGLYLRPEVHIEVEDGRSFVRRSTSKYQIIQATLVDTWASTAAGAFALSENNLYTVDAVHDYLQHLTPDGIVAFTRWGFQPPRESLRLMSLAREALAHLGQGGSLAQRDCGARRRSCGLWRAGHRAHRAANRSRRARHRPCSRIGARI